jgi:hypothetical protein
VGFSLIIRNITILTSIVKLGQSIQLQKNYQTSRVKFVAYEEVGEGEARTSVARSELHVNSDEAGPPPLKRTRLSEHMQ